LPVKALEDIENLFAFIVSMVFLLLQLKKEFSSILKTNNLLALFRKGQSARDSCTLIGAGTNSPFLLR